MAGKTYVTKGYSSYTEIPAARRGGYDHGSNNVVDQYAVDTMTTERVRYPSFPGSAKYSPTSQFEDYEPNYGLNYDNLSPNKSQAQNGPNKNPFSSRVHGNVSDESDMIHSGHGLGGAKHVRTGNISGPNKTWLTTGPPPTHHPLTTSTNNIKEALGFLEDSVYYSPRADPRRRGVLDDLSTRAQPLEPQSRYARPAFVSKPHDAHYNYNTGSNVNSHDATRRYRG